MNRRSFLAGATAFPLASLPGVSASTRQGYEVNGDIRMDVTIRFEHSGEAAELQRHLYTVTPWGDTFGEFYESNRREQDLPQHLADLPGDLVLWDTTVGVAAVEGEMLVGAFRRDQFAYIVRSSTNDPDLIIAIAEHFADTELPTPFAIAWNTLNLRTLLPPSTIGEYRLEPIDIEIP